MIGAAEAEHKIAKVFDEREVLGKKFQIYGTPEDPIFLAKDIADRIENANVSQMLNVVDESEKVLCNVYTLGGIQEAWFVNEDGLMEILFQSRKPIAKEFKRQVKAILKTIKKTGSYSVIPLTELEILVRATQVLADQDRQLKVITEKQDRQAEQLQSIRDIVALNPFDNWRKLTTNLINRIVEVSGYGFDRIRSESYKLLNNRLGISLIRRLKNRQKTALLNGATKSSAEQINYLDVITEDKKLIEGYISIIKEMAVKYGA